MTLGSHWLPSCQPIRWLRTQANTRYNKQKTPSILKVVLKIHKISRASLVVQWMRICLPVQGTWVRSPVLEASTCLGALKPACPTKERLHVLQMRHDTAKEINKYFKKKKKISLKKQSQWQISIWLRNFPSKIDLCLTLALPSFQVFFFLNVTF